MLSSRYTKIRSVKIVMNCWSTEYYINNCRWKCRKIRNFNYCVMQFVEIHNWDGNSLYRVVCCNQLGDLLAVRVNCVYASITGVLFHRDTRRYELSQLTFCACWSSQVDREGSEPDVDCCRQLLVVEITWFRERWSPPQKRWPWPQSALL